jgi:hypothetical protein
MVYFEAPFSHHKTNIMKKFYFAGTLLCLLIFLNATPSRAQTFTISSPGRTWSNTIGTATCTGCTITITGVFSFTVDIAATLVNSTVYVTNNSQLAVNANLTLQNSKIIIGDLNSTSSTANLFISNNDNVFLSDVNSSVRVGNVNNYISGGGGGGGNTPGQIQAMASVFGFGFNIPIFSGNGSKSVSPYSLNCGGTKPNTCKNGFVYGPVINSVTSAGFFEFSTFGTDAPLPVVLGSFSASLNSENAVSVTWTTEQEVNSSHFSIERSSNGASWESIGTVAAKGNSATVSAYSFIDKSPLNGVDYYRLQMVDLDGSYVYSQISVVRSTHVQSISVFPNPARNYINVTLGGTVPTASLRLIDLNGKLLQELRLNSSASNTTVSLPVGGYAQGIYILQAIKTDGSYQSTKVTIAAQ